MADAHIRSLDVALRGPPQPKALGGAMRLALTGVGITALWTILTPTIAVAFDAYILGASFDKFGEHGTVIFVALGTAVVALVTAPASYLAYSFQLRKPLAQKRLVWFVAPLAGLICALLYQPADIFILLMPYGIEVAPILYSLSQPFVNIVGEFGGYAIYNSIVVFAMVNAIGFIGGQENYEPAT